MVMEYSVNDIPLFSLFIALVFATISWRKRHEFSEKPYFHWFLYLHMAAVGLHQFEEYGFPGHFRDAFVSVFGTPQASVLVPSTTELELVNAFVLTTLFAVLGWAGTRVISVGLSLLFVNFANGFFHLIYSVIHLNYVPGAVTGTVLYLPLGMLATHFAVTRGDIDRKKLLLAFGFGTAASFLPFIHIWLLHWVASH